jgi:alkylation response protein AidB-like acyl-CoA dehydrogenase
VDIDDFRDEARTWLAENKPAEPRPQSGQAMRQWDCEWQLRQYDGGWAGLDWPVEYGGRGLGLLERIVWYEEYVQCGLRIEPNCTVVATAHAGPTLIARGNDEQKHRHLGPILRGEQVWCQGFSEPGSGSDLASLRCRGVVDGDDLVVTGQKVWTSFAHVADYQELLVRTDPGAARHRGISWVICDMRLPGIDVRPIASIDGEQHFNEVFYDEVRIPLSNVVDELDNGWSVAMSNLAIERGPIALEYQLRTIRDVDELICLARERGVASDAGLAARLARARAGAMALRAMAYHAVAMTPPGEFAPAVTLTARPFWTELRQELGRLSLDILGAGGLELNGWTQEWLTAFSATIAGGTKDIQKNVIGERVLGLPR